MCRCQKGQEINENHMYWKLQPLLSISGNLIISPMKQ